MMGTSYLEDATVVADVDGRYGMAAWSQSRMSLMNDRKLGDQGIAHRAADGDDAILVGHLDRLAEMTPLVEEHRTVFGVVAAWD